MDEMSTITLFLGAHGYQPTPNDSRRFGLRSSNPHRYDGLTVNFLSFAGYANIRTESGLIFKRKTEAEQKELIQKIAEYDKYKLFTSKPVRKLDGLGTDYVTLSYIVPHIFKDRPITTQPISKAALEDMRSEMLALGMLAALEYSETSPPVIEKNPTFEKMWWFADNPGHDRRRFGTTDRTGPARAAGNTKDNPILATNGLFILHTTNDEHSPFSISNIHARDYDYANKKDGLRIITPVAIKCRNLLRKINYTSYWQKLIEAFDFSGVPDEDVLEIGSIEEAVFIVKQIYYAFHSENAMDDPADPDGVAEIEEEDAEEAPVAEGPPPPPQLSQATKVQLKHILAHAEHVRLNKLIKDANENIQSHLLNLSTAVAYANELEARIKEEEETKPLRSEELATLRDELISQNATVAKLESELDVLQDRIISDVTEFIRVLISQPNIAVNNAIKNIIMRNKLKNILKFGIFHKRLSLSQIILFFRSLGYKIINIVDPTCFVLREHRPLETDIDSQKLSDSQGGMAEPTHPPPNWAEQLNWLADPVEGDDKQRDEKQSAKRSAKHSDKRSDKRSATVSQNGGTKRKRSYSRKRRTRRKKRTRRRTRR